MSEQIRELQKNGIYKFQGMSREESRKAALKLAGAAFMEDRKNGIECQYGTARDVFGYYAAVVIN